MTQQEQPPPSFIVTVVQEPVREQTVADVIIGSLGVAGVLVLLALLLGAIVALVLVVWNRWFRPETDHLPPITSTPAEASPPSSQSR